MSKMLRRARGSILLVILFLSVSVLINVGFLMSSTQKTTFPGSSDTTSFMFMMDVDQLWKYGENVKNATAENVNSLLKYGGDVRDATANKVQEILKQKGISDNPTVIKIYEDLWRSSKVVHHTAMNKIYDLYNRFKSQLWTDGNLGNPNSEIDIKDEFVEMVQNMTRLDMEGDEGDDMIETSTISLDAAPNLDDRSIPVPTQPVEVINPVQAYSGLPLDITKHWNETRILYNRVDGCGSRTLLAIVGILSFELDYHSIWSRAGTAYDVSELKQRSIAKVISEQTQPYIFNRYLYFIDFAKFGLEQPPYINLIREPLPRLISRYHSKTQGDHAQSFGPEGYHRNETELGETLEHCILSGRPECSEEGSFQMIPYFCGHEPECRVPSRWALEKAKQHVVEHYVFVGVLEDFDNSLRIFELLLPQFFEGALKVYRTMISGLKKYEEFQVDTANKYEMPSADTMVEISRRLALEYEFYNFVRTRMEIIKKQLQIE